MTLLENMADAAWAHIDEVSREDCIAGMRAALAIIATPTLPMVNRGGLKAFSGPQPEGGPPMIYPALIWREMLSYVIEERDREPAEEPEENDDDASAEERRTGS